MLDDASLRRLAEMAIDVYVPRAQAGATGVDTAASMAAVAVSVDVTEQDLDVLLLAGASSALVTNVVRAIAASGLTCRPGTIDGQDMDRVRAVVVLGEASAHGVGRLSTQRQQALEMVVGSAPDRLAGSAAAKRALWSELRRLQQRLARRAAPRARPDSQSS